MHVIMLMIKSQSALLKTYFMVDSFQFSNVSLEN